MDRTRDVVITGLGVVSPIGIGKEAYWNSLREHRSGVGCRAAFNGTDWCFRIAAELKDFDPKQYVKPRKSLKVMCREIQMAYAAADLAMQDAGLERGQYDPDRLGVVLGSELFYCDVQEMEAVYRSCVAQGQFDYDAWGQCAMRDIYPLWMLKHLPNMAACHIGIAHDARGPTNTIVAEECSSLDAVIEAAQVIARGHADLMIAGGTGSRIGLTTMVYRGQRDLSRRIDDPEAASRPFDALRDGMVIGEGAGAYVLESRRHAERRAARILARFLGYGQSFQSSTDSAKAAAIRRAIGSALRSAELDARQVGHVNAHGRSTLTDDAIEARAIREALGDIPVTAPKSFFGYLGAGGGAVEMAASVLALTQGEVPVTLNYVQPDPQCPIRVIHDQPHRPGHPTALVLSQSPLGQAAAVVLGGP